jgi:hypothetical protein
MIYKWTLLCPFAQMNHEIPFLILQRYFPNLPWIFVLVFSKFANVDWHLTRCWILKVRCSNNQFFIRLGMWWTKLKSKLAKCVLNNTILSSVNFLRFTKILSQGHFFLSFLSCNSLKYNSFKNFDNFSFIIFYENQNIE